MNKPQQRPMSPYMLGPYYKFQVTSLLSITGRLTGLWLSVVGAPLAIAWLLALASGPEAFAAVQGLLGGFVGALLGLLTLFSLWFHFLNGMRHLLWDTGRGLAKSQIWAGGYLVVAATLILTVLSWWVAS